jgi:hypothetical protein
MYRRSLISLLILALSTTSLPAEGTEPAENPAVEQTSGEQEIDVRPSSGYAAGDGATTAIVAATVGLIVGVAAIVAAIKHRDRHHHDSGSHAHHHAHSR